MNAGIHANLTIGGGPQTNSIVSGPAGGKCSLHMAVLMKPFEYFQFSDGRSKVYLKYIKKIKYINKWSD